MPKYNSNYNYSAYAPSSKWFTYSAYYKNTLLYDISSRDNPHIYNYRAL